jgi:hypothetical protein
MRAELLLRILLLFMILTTVSLRGVLAQNNNASLEMLKKRQKTDTTDYSENYIKGLIDTDTLVGELKTLVDIGDFKLELKSIKQEISTLNVLDRFQKIGKILKDVKQIYTSTDVNLNYYRNSEVDSLTYQNDFLNANVSLNLKLGELPFTLQGSAILEKGRLVTDFSYANFRLDISAYQEALKRKVGDKILKERFDYDKLTDKINLMGKDALVLKSDAQFNVYNTLITHPKVRGLRQNLEAKFDSIKGLLDSMVQSKITTIKDSVLQNNLIEQWSKTPWRDSVTGDWQKQGEEKIELLNVKFMAEGDTMMNKITFLKKLMKMRQTLKSVETKYDSLWEERKMIMGKIEQVKSKVMGSEEEIKQLTDVNSLKNKILSNKYLTSKEKLLMNIKGLEMGQIGVDESDFTLRYKVLNGIQFGYEKEKREWGVLYGKTRIQNFDNPVYLDAFQKTTLGRTFMYAKFSQLMGDSSKVNFSILNVDRSQDTVGNNLTSLNHNTVLSMGYEKNISNRISIETQIALSNTRDESGIRLGESGENWINNMAASNTLFWHIKPEISIGFGYYYVGDRFNTYGNDFLINNRNGFKLSAKSSLLKNRLKFKAELKQGDLNTPSVVGLSAYNIIQATTELSWVVGKVGSLSFQYIPNTLTERPTNREGQGYDYTSNIYLLSGNFNYKIGKYNQKSFFSLSNLNQQLDLFDSLRVNQTEYINFRHESSLTYNMSMVLNTNLGLNENFGVKTGYNQIDLRYKFNKSLRIIVGAQMVKRLGDIEWRKGLVSNIHITLKKAAALKIGVIYRNRKDETKSSRNEWIGTTSISWHF